MVSSLVIDLLLLLDDAPKQAATADQGGDADEQFREWRKHADAALHRQALREARKRHPSLYEERNHVHLSDLEAARYFPDLAKRPQPKPDPEPNREALHPEAESWRSVIDAATAAPTDRKVFERFLADADEQFAR
jgi:hypothetical protein